MRYNDGFKARMIQRMAGPEGISATALAKEVGVRQPTLSRWLRQARTLAVMSGSGSDEQSRVAKSTRQWSADDKFRVVQEATGLSDEELGAYLRREGLHMAQLEEWRALMVSGLAGAKKPKSTRSSAESKRIRVLEKELRLKEEALAEVAALLTLQRKVREIWGDEDDSIHTK